MPEFHHSHAFVIGINDYQNGILQLRTVVNDARLGCRDAVWALGILMICMVYVDGFAKMW